MKQERRKKRNSDQMISTPTTDCRQTLASRLTVKHGLVSSYI